MVTRFQFLNSNPETGQIMFSGVAWPAQVPGLLGSQAVHSQKPNVETFKGLGFRVLGFRVLGFRVYGLGCRDSKVLRWSHAGSGCMNTRQAWASETRHSPLQLLFLQEYPLLLISSSSPPPPPHPPRPTPPLPSSVSSSIASHKKNGHPCSAPHGSKQQSA